MSNKRAISNKKALNETYFKTVGSRNTGDYDTSLHYPDGRSPIHIVSVRGIKRGGLKKSREFISKYILENMGGNPDTIFNQYCVSPYRSPNSKDEWNQFRVSQFI